MKLVTFTTLFPNAEQPHHGVFVEQRLRHLLASGVVSSKVVAPVPWFPFKNSRFGRYAAVASVPAQEERLGIPVFHPRYPVIPKIGMTLAPTLMAWTVEKTFRRILAAGYRFEAIDAHYFYPDGVAAVRIGRSLGIPVVITARGTDLNLIPRYVLPRRQILWAANRCAAIITVCQALKDVLVEMGVPASKVTVLRNGVDLTLFRPIDRDGARSKVGFQGITLLSVGHLIERKGHHIAIEALPLLPEATLVIVGEGPMETQLRALAETRRVVDRVRFAGPVPHADLKYYYSAADALVLASSREGMANVLLESLACGTPVIAHASWGTPEVIADPIAGVLMHRRDAVSVADAFRQLELQRPTREQVRRYAERFGWDATTTGQLEIFRRL